MEQKFRLFIQRHHNGTCTVTVPGLRHVSLGDIWDDIEPATHRLAAHGLILEEVKDDVREALEKWLAKADPSLLSHYSNFKEGQYLEKVEVDLRPTGRDGRKRHDRKRMSFSLLVTPEEDGQLLVSVPKLTEPPLVFYCFNKEELSAAANRELGAYFKEYALEDLVHYDYQRQEMLDTIEIHFNPLKPQRERKKKDDEEEEHSFWALKASGVNLTARAKEKRLSRAYRRDREITEIVNALSSERNRSVILVGPPGAGKTAIVHELARRIAADETPDALRKRQLWQTSSNQLIAGCCYVGQWQDKVQNIVDEVKKKRHIIHVDDVVGLIEAGRWSKGDENMAQFLKPFIADGTVALIGECTPERYRVGENNDPGFTSLFRMLKVEDTSEQDTLGILGQVAAGLEREHNVRIEPGANEAAVELTRRFQPYRSFPGKAISFIERVASDAGAAKNDSGERRIISRQYAVSAFARHTGLPEFILSDHLTLEPASVEHHFAERLIGQPDAVQTVCDLIAVIKAGLNDPNKPLGCFFFVGPTGVGKTEMAKTLAEYLFGSKDRIIRFDMSEYAHPANVARLIGTPAGTEEGELTRQVRMQPFSVVLLDEFEKAHPTIFDVMLQVLGEGRLTDAAGRTADFRSATILMTSNLGASPGDQRKPGLRGGGGSLESHFRDQVERYFRPEFVNRLDRIVVFNSLNRDAMRKIANREISLLLAREGVSRRGLLVEIEEDAVDLILETGFSPEYGARPLKREIERRIIVPLARHLVANRVTGSQLVQMKRDGQEVRLHSSALTTAKQMVKHAPAPLGDSPAARKLDLKQLVEGFATVRLHLHDWRESDNVSAIQAEYRKLLATTRQRKFVPHGKEASRVWGRVYQLERLTKRLDQLAERAEYLEEFAALALREKSTRYQPDLSQSYAELRQDSDYLEIELLCAHVKEAGQALLRIRPVGPSAKSTGHGAWPLVLAGMYLRWAKRKGYEFAVFVPIADVKRWVESHGFSIKTHVSDFDSGPPMRPPWAEVKSGDFNGLLRRLEEVDPCELVLGLKGANVFGFMKGEAGTHKLLIRSDDRDPAAPFLTAAIQVDGLAGEADARQFLIDEWEEQLKQQGTGKSKPKSASAPPPIIRLYAPDGDRFVRDLRTEYQTTQVRSVLEGDLDAFILAYLRSADITPDEAAA